MTAPNVQSAVTNALALAEESETPNNEVIKILCRSIHELAAAVIELERKIETLKTR